MPCIGTFLETKVKSTLSLIPMLQAVVLCLTYLCTLEFASCDSTYLSFLPVARCNFDLKAATSRRIHKEMDNLNYLPSQ